MKACPNSSQSSGLPAIGHATDAHAEIGTYCTVSERVLQHRSHNRRARLAAHFVRTPIGIAHRAEAWAYRHGLQEVTGHKQAGASKPDACGHAGSGTNANEPPVVRGSACAQPDRPRPSALRRHANCPAGSEDEHCETDATDKERSRQGHAPVLWAGHMEDAMEGTRGGAATVDLSGAPTRWFCKLTTCNFAAGA